MLSPDVLMEITALQSSLQHWYRNHTGCGAEGHVTEYKTQDQIKRKIKKKKQNSAIVQAGAELGCQMERQRQRCPHGVSQGPAPAPLAP